MRIISSDAAKKFCELCNWAYEAWITHKSLFDNNALPERNIGKSAYFTSRLSIITQEYVLLQIAKLHDPSIQRNSLNLTIDYFIRFGDWGENDAIVSNLAKSLSELWLSIKPARHKLLAHNDLEALVNDVGLGSFSEGLDEKYFEQLQQLVNFIHDKWVGGPYPFNDLAVSDVEEFLALLNKA